MRILTGTFLLLSVLGLVLSGRADSVSSAATKSTCTVFAESYMTVHVVDKSGKPIPNATVLLSGTFSCQPADNRLNQSGITDSNGNVRFVVIPYAKYNITVALPQNFQDRTIVITEITAPIPTFSTAVQVTYSGSANAGTEAQTTPVTENRLNSLDVLAVLMAIIIGFFVLIKKRRMKAAS